MSCEEEKPCDLYIDYELYMTMLCQFMCNRPMLRG
jgi:hypothetical protein